MIPEDRLYWIYFFLVILITSWTLTQIAQGNLKGKFLTGFFIEDQHNLEDYMDLNQLKAHKKIRDRNFTEKINSYGFKDEEWPVNDSKDIYRVIALGDSMTFGVGVSNRFTWPEQLEQRLNEENPSTRFEVLNMGYPGSGMYKKVEIFKNYSSIFSPDLVILQYYPDDWGSPNIEERYKRIFEKWKKGEYSLPERLKGAVRKNNLSEEDVRILIGQYIKKWYQKNADRRREWERWVRGPLTDLIQICRRREIPLTVIGWDDVRKKGRTAELLKNYSVPFYVFSEYLPARPLPSKYRLSDGHLSPHSYEIVANRTLEALENESLLDDKYRPSTF